MREQNIQINPYYYDIRVIKIVGEESQEESSAKAKAILSMKGNLINILSKKLQVFLKDNLISGGIMDMNSDRYEFELILPNIKGDKEEEKKTAASYMIDFLDILREEYSLSIDNNFDGLEITSEELEKLLKS